MVYYFQFVNIQLYILFFYGKYRKKTLSGQNYIESFSRFTAGATAVAGQSDPIQKRNALMKSMWSEAFSVPFRMSRGQEPFDTTRVESSLAKMSDIVAQLPPLWPPTSKPPANPDGSGLM